MDETATTPMGRVPAFEAFIREHPEHIPGVRDWDCGGRTEVIADTETIIAFARWTAATGRAEPSRVKRYLRDLKRRCLAQGLKWPEGH